MALMKCHCHMSIPDLSHGDKRHEIIVCGSVAYLGEYYRCSLIPNLTLNYAYFLGWTYILLKGCDGIGLMEVLNRLRNNDAVQKTWSWNGHIRALLKNGKRFKSDRLSQLKTVLLNEVLMSRCVPVVDVLVMLIHCLSYMYINVAS